MLLWTFLNNKKENKTNIKINTQ